MRNALVAIVASLAVASLGFGADSPVRIDSLRTEHLVNPIGIGTVRPRLSWKLISIQAGEKQTAYEVHAATTRDKLQGSPDLWASGKVASDQSVLVPWGGSPLASRTQAFWQVRIWDKDGNASAWSEPASIELGLLEPASEWKGKWITIDLPRYDIVKEPLAKANWISAGTTANQPVGVRTTIELPANAKVLSATLDASADGLISLYVNGKATLQGPSSHTAPFHADFGQQLTGGKNLIAIGALAVRNARGQGGKNAIAAHGTITLDGGKQIEFDTDASWKATIPATEARGRGPAAAPADPATLWYSSTFDDASLAAAQVIGPYSAAKVVASADSTIGAGRYLRKSFNVKGPVSKARLYATALGTYEASINGTLVSDDQLAPGWTDYYKRVMVQTYDVTRLLKPGQPNALGAVVSDGWYVGRLGWMGLMQYSRIGTQPLFNAQLEISYADGSSETIATDPSWKGGPGEIVGSDQQLGEVLDARAAVPFDQASFNDSNWKPVSLEEHANIALDPQRGVPVRRLMELKPKKINRIGDMWIVDFGQNFVGHIRLSANGSASSTVQVLHGEALNPDGTIYNENLRQAISFDSFTFAGGKLQTLEPHFTFHGFRYAQLTGYPGELTADKVLGIVVGSDTPDTGKIVTSNADINQLVSNIRWGQRGNFLSVPTDCPQRDERQGWMGDAQVFAPTASYNADVSGFFSKWMVDVNDGQLTDGNGAGAYCVTSPRVANQQAGYPIWGDAGVIIPWVMYTTYGDRGFLEQSYEHMARWVDYSQRAFPDLISTGGVGDNLAPPGGRGAFAGGRGAATAPAAGGARGARGGGFGGANPTSIIDTAYFAHSADIVAKTAAILGKTDEAAKYDKLFHDITDTFNKTFVKEDGSITGGTQTSYVVALSFGLIPENLRTAAAKHLIEDVESKEHLSTGFVGVGFINPILCAIGRPDLAYKLLLTDTYPSWLFTVRQGATTIWERWDGYTPERGFQTSSMNSFNHYSLGSVGLWLYTGPAGIQLDEKQPGFKHFNLAPQISTALGSWKATLDSPYGPIVSGWQIENGRVNYDATIPPNSSATLTLPAEAANIKVTGVAANQIQATGSTVTLQLPAGTYHLSFPVPK